MKGFFHLTINGSRHQVEGDSINRTLLDYLRAHRLVSVRDGDHAGASGSATVLLVDRNSHGNSVYRAVDSGHLLLPMMADREVLTVEALAAGGPLHPVQESLERHVHATCGFCLPGATLNFFEAWYRKGNDGAFRDQLAGYVCRCGNYRALRDAASDLTERRNGAVPVDDFTRALADSTGEASPCEYVDAADGRFYRPFTLTELLRMKMQYPDARLVAGGTRVGPEVARGNERFRCVISLEAIPELKSVVRHNGYWEVGSAVTLTQFEEGLEGESPILTECLRRYRSRAWRNRSTLGGELASAPVAGELVPVLMALEGAVRLASLEGEREVPIDRFFEPGGGTVMRADEIIKDLRLPRYMRAHQSKRGVSTRLSRSYRAANRHAVDDGMVSCGFAAELDEERKVLSLRLAFAGVGPSPGRARAAEAAMEGKPWKESSVKKAMTALRGEFEPPGDELASAEYRGGLVLSLFEKFYREFAPGTEKPKPLGLASTHAVGGKEKERGVAR